MTDKLRFIALAILLSVSVFGQDLCQPMGWATYDGQSASSVTGGGNATPIKVTTFADLKREAESTGPKVIYVMNDMGSGYKGESGDRLIVKSDKTIIGFKPGITIKSGWLIKGVSNVIIKNLICRGPGNSNSEQNWDCVNIENSKKVWFDHCTIMEGEDGNFDVVKGADNVTATWCKFTYVTGGPHNFSNLIGSSDNESISHGKLNVTYAYCWWDNVSDRTPRSRYGKIHVLNCYYTQSGGPNAGFMANQRIEACHFDNSEGIGTITTGGQVVTAAIDCIGQANKTISEGGYTIFNPPYPYKKYLASEVKGLVTNSNCGAGPTMASPTSCGCGTDPNIAPTVNITSPANNASFAAPATITFNANALDTDGSVSKVEFYNGNTLLGSDNASPYTYTWVNVAAGTYTITAKATDNLGATTTSSAITIVVQAKPTDCAGVENGSAILDNCGRCAGGTTGKLACSSVGEVETDACSYNGVEENKNTGFKGGAYINVDNAVGTSIIFHVVANSTGVATLSFRYANGGTTDRTAQVSVNGKTISNTIGFSATGAFADWKVVDVSLSLLQGVNEVKLISATADGLANMDQIGYVSAGLSKGSCTITEIKDIQNASAAMIYPNPFKEQFVVEASTAFAYEIMDMNGKILESGKSEILVKAGAKLQPGTYLLKIQTQDTHKVLTIIKE